MLKIKPLHCFFYIICSVLTTTAYPFVCYLTIAKDSCWLNYNVDIKVTDTGTGQELIAISIPKGKNWDRIKFDCQNGQTLSMEAQFSPVFWEGEEQKKYPGKRFWKLPQEVESGVTGWNVTVCYPKWFSDVPVPPDAGANCQCNTEQIPAAGPSVTPKK